jgi:hypothetical protein
MRAGSVVIKQDAIRIAEAHLRNLRSKPYPEGEERVVDDEWTIERDYGWLFTFNTAEYVRTRDRRFRLIGNGPLLVRRDDGSVIEFSSAYDGEEALAEYEADPGRFPAVEPRS